MPQRATAEPPFSSSELPLASQQASFAARQERKRRRKLSRHHYTDAELRKIMDETWIHGNEYGTIKGNPEFIAQYVDDPVLSDDQKATLLARRMAVNLSERLFSQLGQCFPQHSTRIPPLPSVRFDDLMDCQPEALVPIAVKSGEPLFENSTNAIGELTAYGTLGAILTIESPNHLKHVGMTVGHVLGDCGNSVRMGPRDGTDQLKLKAFPGCERLLGSPYFRSQWLLPRACLDEICLLSIPICPSIMNLNCVIPNLDCRKISAISPTIKIEEGIVSPGTPLLQSVRKLQYWVNHQGFLMVFKNGATTGTTCGKLIEVEEKPNGKEQPCRRNLTFTFSDETDVYVLRIKWLSPEQPFAEAGDSGSLVYAKANGHIIPLEIHWGSQEDIKHRIFTTQLVVGI
ncbi:hypothetical protein MMC07_005013 [Pseudocyphellaria aurata]|nr:hypothetical protein [Pseudocyphellaria aurata]